MIYSAATAALAGGRFDGSYLCERKVAAGVKYNGGAGWHAVEFNPINFLMRIELVEAGGEDYAAREDYRVTISAPTWMRDTAKTSTGRRKASNQALFARSRHLLDLVVVLIRKNIASTSPLGDI